ncbi:MAG: selenocysteine-specific translation elongation factor [Carbonactinosporaceae bacterium]
MHVVATAGHVDHGKSTLIRALTGMEPDRWDEERRRGLTIDLGFAWTRLPSGREIAFVDVPGHERFVGNMLAGIGPVSAVMIVVAADEGWQPQSEEHLEAIDALEVRHGLLVVTRRDLADPAAAAAQARERLATTSLRSVETLSVSGVTGEGLDALRATLDRLVAALPAPDVEAPVRLWVDRAFTIRGRGTVVTGTLSAGTVAVGDELVLVPSGRRVRVRGLEALKAQRDRVGAVARVAVNLRGVGAGEVRRGHALLTPGRWLSTPAVDARLRGAAPSDLPAWLTFHIGSAAVPARLRPLGADTVRLTLARELPLRIGDRALLRDPGRHRVPAGVTVLDVHPPGLVRRGASRERARVLDSVTGVPDVADELRRRRLVRRSELVAMGVEPPADPVHGQWFADPAYWDDLKQRLTGLVSTHAQQNQLDPGVPLEVARRALALPELRLVEALVRPPLRVRNGKLYGPQAAPVLPAHAQQGIDAIRRDLAAAPFNAPDANRLAALGLTPRYLAAAAEAGALLRVADGVFLLPGADESAAGVLAGLDQPFTASEARQALGTSRRVAVPLLELLDARGYTRRLDEAGRRRVR